MLEATVYGPECSRHTPCAVCFPAQRQKRHTACACYLECLPVNGYCLKISAKNAFMASQDRRSAWAS